MSNEFYGPKADAEKTINQLLNFPATGKEQDWEIELADSTRVDELIDAFASLALDLDTKSALGLILISSMEEANEFGTLNDVQIRRANQLFLEFNDVRERMRFYWLELEKANDSDLVSKILGPISEAEY